MSSLAASRADNFYFPPDWRPEYGGISKFQGSTGANQYQKYGIIRFELPFDAWCLKCERHMCKGLRFNAKKDKDGKYFSTIIYKFTMKCYSCDQEFVVKTNPKDSTYDMVEGLRKMEQDFTPDPDDSLIQVNSDEVRLNLSSDPMFRLQHENEDMKKAQTAQQRVSALIDLNESQYKDNYANNKKLRSSLREKKRHAEQLQREGAALGLSIPLSEESEADRAGARQANFSKAEEKSLLRSKKSRISEIQCQSIFSGPVVSSSSTASKLKLHRNAMRKQAAANIDVSHCKTVGCGADLPAAVIAVVRKAASPSTNGADNVGSAVAALPSSSLFSYDSD